MSDRLGSILVIGATGYVGWDLSLELLKLKDRFRRLAIFNNTMRSSTEKDRKISQLSAQGMEVVTSNTFADPKLYRGFDTIVMATGSLINHMQPVIIDAAIEGGVRHFYPSEFGADIELGDSKTQRYYRDKVMTRNHLENRAKEVDGLGWTYITCGRFTQWGITSYFGVFNETHTASIYGTENSRQSLISLEDVMKFTTHSLLLPFDKSAPKSRQRTFRFHGESPSWKELFDMLKLVTGHEYKVTYHPVSEAWELLREAKAKNDDKLEMQSSHRIVQGTEGTLIPEPYDNDKFPDVKPRGLEDVLRETFVGNKYKTFIYSIY